MFASCNRSRFPHQLVPITIFRAVLFSTLFLLFPLFAGAQNVLTYHNDKLRTGRNLAETTLTPNKETIAHPRPTLSRVRTSSGKIRKAMW